jgi:hypothetical protein
MLSVLCAKHLDVAGIVATDGDEAVVDTIKTNLFLNGLDSDDSSTGIWRTAALKWGWPMDATTFAEDYGMEAPDVLLGADVVRCLWRQLLGHHLRRFHRLTTSPPFHVSCRQ